MSIRNVLAGSMGVVGLTRVARSPPSSVRLGITTPATTSNRVGQAVPPDSRKIDQSPERCTPAGVSSSTHLARSAGRHTAAKESTAQRPGSFAGSNERKEGARRTGTGLEGDNGAACLGRRHHPPGWAWSILIAFPLCVWSLLTICSSQWPSLTGQNCPMSISLSR